MFSTSGVAIIGWGDEFLGSMSFSLSRVSTTKEIVLLDFADLELPFQEFEFSPTLFSFVREPVSTLREVATLFSLGSLLSSIIGTLNTTFFGLNFWTVLLFRVEFWWNWSKFSSLFLSSLFKAAPVQWDSSIILDFIVSNVLEYIFEIFSGCSQNLILNRRFSFEEEIII